MTAGGTTYHLPDPFFVLATQNPIEQEGTYPLPEAQLDRFMLELRVGYPSRTEEEAIVEQTTGAARGALQPVLDAASVLAMQALVRRIPVSRGLIRAAVTLARMTRPPDPQAPAFIKEYVDWGAGPRASQYLVLGAKARAAMSGRPMADLEDVRTRGAIGASSPPGDQLRGGGRRPHCRRSGARAGGWLRVARRVRRDRIPHAHSDPSPARRRPR